MAAANGSSSTVPLSEVQHDDQQAVEDHHAHDQGVIAVQRAGDEVAAESRDCVDALYNDRARDQPRGGWSHERDDRQQRRFQRVFADHDVLGQALGPGGADEVAVQDLDHAAPGEARDIGDHRQGQGDDRQDHALHRPVPAAGGQPAGIDCEHQDQQRRHHEIGYRYAQHGESHGAVIGRGVLAHGSQDADRGAHQESQQHGQSAHRQRHRKALTDQFIDRPVLVLKRGAEIQGNDLPEVSEILLYQWFIEMVLGFQVGLDFRRQGLLGIKRSAGRDPHQEKHHRDQQQQGRHHPQQALDGMPEYAVTLDQGVDSCTGAASFPVADFSRYM
jgi:hypothetical protein